MNCFVISDPNKCIGCRTCSIACVVAHSEENIFLQDPNHINFNPRLTVVKTAQVSAPIQCRQCEDAPCANVCPNEAIKRENGAIVVKEEKCVGCKTCIIACPIGAIEIVSKEIKLDDIDSDKLYFKEQMVANKCDLCVGKEDGPACVSVCPTKAFKIVKEDDVKLTINNKRKQAAACISNL